MSALLEELKECPEVCHEGNCVTCNGPKIEPAAKVYSPETVSSLLWEGLNALYNGMGIKNYTKFILEYEAFSEAIRREKK